MEKLVPREVELWQHIKLVQKRAKTRLANQTQRPNPESRFLLDLRRLPIRVLYLRMSSPLAMLQFSHATVMKATSKT